MRVDSALEAVAVAAVFLCCRTLHTHWAGAVGAGSFANGVGLSERALDSLVLSLKTDISIRLVHNSYRGHTYREKDDLVGVSASLDE